MHYTRAACLKKKEKIENTPCNVILITSHGKMRRRYKIDEFHCYVVPSYDKISIERNVVIINSYLSNYNCSLNNTDRKIVIQYIVYHFSIDKYQFER